MRDMQLRAHPKMNWEGFSNWPPAWAGSYGAKDVFPGEEEGVLTGVEMSEAGNTFPRHLVFDHDAPWDYLIGDALLRQRRGGYPSSSRFSKAASAWR
jgi:hypothetical protein